MVMESAAVSTGDQLEELKKKGSEKDVEIGRLTGEAEALREQIAKLTAENESLRAQVDKTYGKTIEQYATTNEEKVRLRAKPDTGSRRIRELKLGTRVLVEKEIVNDQYESWAAVDIDGQKGYIMMKYLNLEKEPETEKEEPSTEEETPAYDLESNPVYEGDPYYEEVIREDG